MSDLNKAVDDLYPDWSGNLVTGVVVGMRGDGKLIYEESEAEYEGHLQLNDDEAKRRRQVQSAEEAIEGIVAALEDGTYWLSDRKKKINVNRLTKTHCENIVGFLERRAPLLHDYVQIRMLGRAPSNEDTQAAIEFDDAFDHLMQMDPKDWLKEQPLMDNLRLRAQRKLVKSHGVN